MNAYIFFSVHEELFWRIADKLRAHGVTSFSGFLWSDEQRKTIEGHGVKFDPLLVFSRDMLSACNDGQTPDLAWIRQREVELGISLQRMITAERHLLKGRSYTQIMRMVEVALRSIAEAYDRAKPDFVFSEDISCLHSYLHFAIARERRIKFWCITSGRLPYRLSVYSGGMMRWERLQTVFADLQQRGMTAEERRVAEEYVHTFRNRPARPTGMDTRARRPRIEFADLSRFRFAASRYLRDRGNPTAVPPLRAIGQRVRRITRVASADVLRMFERPVEGEKYVLYPIHFQPEASTLVQAPMYLDQVALLREIASSLPGDHRPYVKGTVSNRGRRPLEFYDQAPAIPSVRLLGPDEDTWTLIRNASVIAVITGTVGWEGLLFDKPVITFGDVFFNQVPCVYRAGLAPKDDWYRLFEEAATKHRPDPPAVLHMVSALHQASYPGFMGNPWSFPEVLEPENVANLVHALATEAGLPALQQSQR